MVDDPVEVLGEVAVAEDRPQVQGRDEPVEHGGEAGHGLTTVGGAVQDLLDHRGACDEEVDGLVRALLAAGIDGARREDRPQEGQPVRPATGAAATMAQRDRQFQPQLLVVQTGTAVNFPNFDTVRHHVYSFSPTKKFELKLYSGTPAEPVVFDKPGVAQLGCNIHDRMSAHIVVVDTPLFGITDAKGEVTLNLPPGEHRLRLWATRMGNAAPSAQPLVVAAGAASVLKVELKD